MKKGKSLFSWTRVICLTVALIAVIVMAYAMTVDTLSQTQPTLIVGGQNMAAQPFVKTATLNIIQTDQGLVALTAHKGQFAGQWVSFAVAEVPEPYNNLIFVSVSIKGKGTLAGMDTINTYTCKTIMVENQGWMGGISPQLVTNQKTLKI